jgi:hypothetical protein
MIKLRFDIFGFHVAGITIHLPDSEPILETVVSRGVKAMSKAWIRKMMR